MKSFSRWAALAVLALAFAAMGGWACTDDEGNELTLEEYFAALEELDATANEQTDALFAGIDNSSDVEDFRGALSGIPEIVAEFNSGLEDLDPPDEAQEAHDAAVAAAEAFAEAQETALAEAEDAETVEELDETFNDHAFAQADEAFQDACTDLVQIAIDNNIDVDLGCEQEA
jgi:hypothetical protein